MSDPSWTEIFGHAEPYSEQADGIDAAIDTAAEGGYTVIEGACGTGKTMLALTAGIDRVRDPDSPFERVVVLTSVKQQLRQFETDLETINGNLPAEYEPISGLTIVGKADVCPYSREHAGGIDETTVYERCEGLRERTRNLVGEDGPTTPGALTDAARRAQTGLADSGSGGPTYLETAGEPTPYLPETAEHGDGTGSTEYCPFYATFLDDLPADGEPIEAVPFDVTNRGLIDTAELVALAAGHGSCPHSVMGAVLPHVEVVIGNYYHAFDPVTSKTFTGPLVDDSTFLVCDEAHMLEPRVRDLVSRRIGDRSLRTAESELTRLIQALTFDGQPTDDPDVELIRGELRASDVSLEEITRYRDFVGDLREEVDRRVRAYLDRERPDWRADLDRLEDAEIPLRDPDAPAPDEISEWAAQAGYTDAVWSRAEIVGTVVGRILNEVDDEDVTRSAPAVGRTLGAWYRADHESYFREIELDRTFDRTEPTDSWRRAYTAGLLLYNCVPGDAIGERLAEFGGGVLMSATLAPIDVFEQVTGLEHLRSAGRPIERRTYGMTFPESNRASFAVDAPAFTYENRGDSTETTPTRQAHADAVVAVAESPGNVLVGMPSYAEAEWMSDVLNRRVDKPVLLDTASGDRQTDSLKRDFFAGESKVLVTSLRGTLTEGVDYSGDRLTAAVVCGVPIVNTASPRTTAVRTAYDRRFGNGFETALIVPAVRKARQAIGRVIRGREERGVRVLVDSRYARESWDSVRQYLPRHEREEFQPVSPDMLEFGLNRFWTAEELVDES
ncbi:MAG: ATP-dependent DNA helicase [Halobacteriota archaeon]